MCEFVNILENINGHQDLLRLNDEERKQLCREIQRRYAAAAADCGSRQVSLSIGVAEYRRQESTEWLLDRADAILYRAKQNKGSILLETN